MRNFNKYSRGYFLPPTPSRKWTEKEYITEPPVWCSVDLRDGNQALIIPMTLDQKMGFFGYLTRIGFKEIEIGFPAASETEYNFCRKLIEDNAIPDDVSIQLLTQSREHIIAKTFEAARGAKNVIIHLYNSTSPAQREQVFGKSKADIIDIAVKGAELFNKYKAELLSENPDMNIRFEYSPESFSATEPEFALEICNAVLDVWKPSKPSEVIINLPSTVELALPHIFASQVEYMSDNLKYRQNVSVSIHAHNDRGTAVASTELALLAGADRVEGTLFGNGERTGNCDLVTVAMNMYMHGIDPKLDFADITETARVYTEYTDMSVNPRSPYGGALVFAAFSGSHQDAIAKGLKHKAVAEQTANYPYWNVPYLAIDPSDVGRELETDVIRINSQSGKGGVGYILERGYGYNLPPKFREAVGYAVKDYADKTSSQLNPDTVFSVFKSEFINVETPYKFTRIKTKKMNTADSRETRTELFVVTNNTPKILTGYGDGPLDAAVNALHGEPTLPDFTLTDYASHTLAAKQDAEGVSYVEITDSNGKKYYGAGVDTDTTNANIRALLSAVNKL